MAAVALLASSGAFAWAARAARVEPPAIAIVPGVALNVAGTNVGGDADARPALAAQSDSWGEPADGDLVDFARLSFEDYDPMELRGPDAVALRAEDFPASVRDLDGFEVRVGGFPLVSDLEDGRVAELYLTRFPPGCCFGSLPVLDEWIHVTLAEPIPPRELPLTAHALGRLEVGEQLDSDGYALSLYRMTGAVLEER